MAGCCGPLRRLGVGLWPCKIDLSPPVTLFYVLVFEIFVLLAPYVCFHILVKLR